jgi:hypothetical protein
MAIKNEEDKKFQPALFYYCWIRDERKSGFGIRDNHLGSPTLLPDKFTTISACLLILFSSWEKCTKERLIK